MIRSGSSLQGPSSVKVESLPVHVVSFSKCVRTLSGCRDPVAVLQTRAKRAREMEARRCGFPRRTRFSFGGQYAQIEFELIASGKKVEPPKAQPRESWSAKHAFLSSSCETCVRMPSKLHRVPLRLSALHPDRTCTARCGNDADARLQCGGCARFHPCSPTGTGQTTQRCDALIPALDTPCTVL